LTLISHQFVVKLIRKFATNKDYTQETLIAIEPYSCGFSSWSGQKNWKAMSR
jgi:hypothetical protein